MIFEDPRLVKKYGSWIRVQVQFYDFIFRSALEICPAHFRENVADEAMSGGFADGQNFYETCVGKIEEHFKSFDQAWKIFLESEINETLPN